MDVGTLLLFVQALARQEIFFSLLMHLAIIHGFILFRSKVMLVLFSQISIISQMLFQYKNKSCPVWLEGEYHSLNKKFENQGINHLVMCPRMHQQNGAIESKHRHIMETGLVLLSWANVLQHFCDDAFTTVYYLIISMPTHTLQNLSPYEILFTSPPDCSFLRVFGCTCWPNLRPYNAHKLQPRSLPYVSLGYSPLHKMM